VSDDKTTTDIQPELLPCPFCGGEAELTGHHAPEFWVHCPVIGCKAGTEAFGSKERAIAAWNHRSSFRKSGTDDTVAFVQSWLMSSDHEPSQWDRDFAAAIDARTTPTSTTPTLGDMEVLRAFSDAHQPLPRSGGIRSGLLRVEPGVLEALDRVLAVIAAAPASPILTSVNGAGVREANLRRLAREDADALDRTADEADDANWQDWAATMRQAATRLRDLTNFSPSLLEQARDAIMDMLRESGGQGCAKARKVLPRIIAALSPALDNTAVEGLTTAAREVLKHRVGEQPTRGYLRDNDRSRTALTALATALAQVSA